MSKALATKNVAAALVVLALMIGAFAFATPARAQTVNDLQAQIQVLLAQIAALQGGTTGGACFTFTMNLTVGSTGNEVMQLQKFLNGKGFTVAASGAGSVGNETAYFGSLTQAAVAKFQAANGITPTAGYFGPITRTKVNSMCVVVAPPPGPPGPPGAPGPTPPGPLQGGAGSITDVDYVSALSNEEVGEGADDVEVAGFDIEADDGSDIELTALNLNFSDVGATNNEPDLDDYASEVSVWFDGKEIARVDASDFDSDNSYDKTLTLDSGAIIRKGDTEKLTVAVSGAGNIDSASAGDSWSVELESVRFRDAQASVITDSSTGVINDATGRTFTVETFATAADVLFKIASDDAAINDPRVVDVNATNKTTNVKLASFTLEAVGDSDLKIEDFHASTTVTGATNVDDILSGGTAPAIRLVIDGASYGTAAYANDTDGASVGTDEGIHFDEVNYTLAAGDKVDAYIEADLLAVSGNLDVGDTIQVDVGENETDRGTLFRVEDETGEALADADKTGTVTGGPHAVYDSGLNLSFVSASTAINSDGAGGDDDDVGIFTLVFDVTSFGGTVYVSTSTAATTADIDVDTGLGTVTDGILYVITDSGTATTDDLADSVTFTTPSGVSQTSSVGNIQINEGKTTRISLTVTQTNNDASDDGIYRMYLEAVGWSAADDTTYEFMYYFDLPEEVTTSTISIN